MEWIYFKFTNKHTDMNNWRKIAKRERILIYRVQRRIKKTDSFPASKNDLKTCPISRIAAVSLYIGQHVMMNKHPN